MLSLQTVISLNNVSALWNSYYCYRLQTKLRKGNVFTSMCQEFCPLGGRSIPPRQTPPPPGRHPPSRHPPQARHLPGRHPSGQTPSQRWPLQWAVCILLECILALTSLCSAFLDKRWGNNVILRTLVRIYCIWGFVRQNLWLVDHNCSQELLLYATQLDVLETFLNIEMLNF